MQEARTLKLDSKTLRFEEKITRLISSGEKRKASNLIEKEIEEGRSQYSNALLKVILEPSGMTVAHKLALKGHEFTDFEILSLTGEDRSKQNSVYGHNGCSVAFILAKKGQKFSDPNVLKLGSEKGLSTVAHAMAAQGFTFDDKDILKLRDDKGTTVAHVMAANGFKFTDKDILALENNFGFTVLDFQTKNASAHPVDV